MPNSLLTDRGDRRSTGLSATDPPRNRVSAAGGLAALALSLAGVSAARSAEDDAPSWLDVDRSSLVVVVELASDVPVDRRADRDRLLEPLMSEIDRLREERELSASSQRGEPDPEFRQLVASDSDRAPDYLAAMRRSYLRFEAARAANDPEWMARQMTAARKYAGLAAAALRRSAQAIDERAAGLKSDPLAVRRSLEKAASFHESLRRNGLIAEHRKFLLDGGMTAQDVAAYEAELGATPPGDLGISVAEYYALIADHRRTVAAGLDHYAAVGVYRHAQGSPQTVVNPKDREATIDLHIRPASIPPGWTLSVVDPTARKTDQKAAAGESRVEEVVPGKLYRVRLAAREEIQLASVATPVGEVGKSTTIRWAVEARVGEELVGGTVHELRVPGYLPDLELPLVRDAGSPTPEPPAAPAGNPGSPPPDGKNFDWRGAGLVAAGTAAVLVAIAVVRRRRSTRR